MKIFIGMTILLQSPYINLKKKKKAKLAFSLQCTKIVAQIQTGLWFYWFRINQPSEPQALDPSYFLVNCNGNYWFYAGLLNKNVFHPRSSE